MLTEFIRQFKSAILLFIILTLLTGIIYPCMITGAAQIFFSWKANGSLIKQNGKIIGSQFIGQSFTDSSYFWGRPSATSPFPYNAAYSSGSNLGPTNPVLLSTLKNRITLLQQADKNNQQLIPVHLVTASASGLDPDISPESAFYQVSRIAKQRQLPPEKIIDIINQSTRSRWLRVIGEPRVNVLQLNLALFELSLANQNRNSHERKSP
jgi:K+-transporting ATPase ATPase C chain